MKKTIDDVVAEAAIRDLQILYCRAMDRLDFDLLRSCFHSEAILDYGFYRGDVEGLIAMAQGSLGGFLSTTHFTGNQLVRVSGDKAWAEHYTSSSHRFAPDGSGIDRELIAVSRYVDDLQRRDGDWRIVRRLLIQDCSRLDIVTNPGSPPGAHRGIRDGTDASYRKI